MARGVNTLSQVYDLETAGYYTKSGKPVIYIKARDKDKKPIVIRKRDVQPWFFSEADGITEHRGIDGEWLLKHTYVRPQDTPMLRKKYPKTWRAKMPFAYNYLADRHIYDGFQVKNKTLIPAQGLGIQPRVGYGDIEVSSPPAVMADPSYPTYPVVTIQWGDSYTGEIGIEALAHPDAKKVDYDWVHYHDEEVDVFNAYFDVIRRYNWDALLYHYGWQFDYPYLYGRGKRIGARPERLSPVARYFVTYAPMKSEWNEPNSVGIDCLDSHRMYTVLSKPEGKKRFGNSLKMIVGNECDFWYTDYGDQIERLWAEDHETLMQYGRNDIIALQKMDAKRSLVRRFDSIRRVLGVPLPWATQNMKFIQTYLTRISSELGVEIPTWQYKTVGKYEGATVQDGSEVRGYHENVAILDLASMYPNIIVSLNLSLETKYIDDDGNTAFRRAPIGILPTALKRLMAERERVRALRENIPAGSDKWWELYYYDQAFKYAVNSFYGAMKKIDVDVAATTTKNGRLMIRALHEAVRQFGYDVIYWDTDSIFIKMPTSRWEDGIEMERLAQEALDDYSKELGAVFPFRIKYEAFYRRLLIAASKHYIAHATMEDKESCDQFIIKGVSIRKSDSSLLSGQVGEAFLKGAIKHGKIKESLAMVKYVHDHMDNVPWKYLFLPLGFTKSFDKYERPSPWIRGGMNAERIFGRTFSLQDKLQLLYLKPDHPPYVKELVFEGLETGREPEFAAYRLDWKMMRRRILRDKLEDFVDLLGYDWGVISGAGVQQKGKDYWNQLSKA